MDELTDQTLLQRCRAGDAKAWSSLVRRYASLVYTVPRRARLSGAAVDDVFQLTWMRLVEHLDTIEDPTRVRAWLVTTALRETLAQIRDTGRTGAADSPAFDPDAVPDPGPTPEAILAEWQEACRLRMGVQRLDTRCREILTAVYLLDPPEPQAELAERLGVARNSISPMRTRCLDALLRQLDDEPSAPHAPPGVRSSGQNAL